jgi:PIN domain nuclease of toxin-antitoxin system
MTSGCLTRHSKRSNATQTYTSAPSSHGRSQGKVRLRKWPEAELVADRFFETVAHYSLTPLPVTLERAHLAGSLPGTHRDPFDRMLTAQAMVERMPLVKADPAFRAFDVEVLW